jgi:hypothetical protein
MSMIAFDTLKFAEKLRESGIAEAQAKAEAEALSIAFAEAMDSQIATRRDVSDVKTELAVMKWMIGFNLAFTLAILWKIFS